MKKWMFLVAIAGGLVGCADQEGADEGREPLRAEEGCAIDGGASSTPPSEIDAGTSPTEPEEDAAVSEPEPEPEPASGGIGAACTAASDCGGEGARCTTQVSIPIGGLSIDFAGGYCTKSCTADAECGPGAGCPLAGAAAFLPELASCLKQCEETSECRDGYACSALPSFPGLGGPSVSSGAPQKHCLPPLPFPSGGPSVIPGG